MAQPTSISRCPSLEPVMEELGAKLTANNLQVEIVSPDCRGRSPSKTPLAEYYNRKWTRRFSPNRGDYLKVEDEMTTVTRGGTKYQIVRKTSHNIPTVIIGHLDPKGKEILDKMLTGTETIDEIIEFFKNYKIEDGRNNFEPRVYRSNKSSRQSSLEPEEDIFDRLNNLRGSKISSGNDNHKMSKSSNIDAGKSLKENVSKKSIVNVKTNSENSANKQQFNRSRTSSENLPELQEVGDSSQNNQRNLDDDERNKSATDNFKNKINQNDKEMSDDHLSRNIEPKDRQRRSSSTNSTPKRRNVFDVVDADFIKRMIPFMHPSSRNHTFKYFLEKVDEVVETVGEDKLIDEDILDIMQFRMGGSYLTEMKELRSNHTLLDTIKNFFRNKDGERDEKAQKQQEILLKSSQVGDDIWLRRPTMSQLWGVNISYSYTPDYGLVLVLSSVLESSPAWQCGLRQGDSILQINEWRIACMDKPEVAVHLFQAGAHRVKLGVLRGNILQSSNFVGVF